MHTHSSEHTPGAVGSQCCGARGGSWGFGALLKGLTSVVVLRVERVLVIHSPPPTLPCWTWDSNPWPSNYKSNSLYIRPQLPYIYIYIYIYIRGITIRVFVLKPFGTRLSVRCALQTERFVGLILLRLENKRA